MYHWTNRKLAPDVVGACGTLESAMGQTREPDCVRRA
jgi:hypothetical protein